MRFTVHAIQIVRERDETDYEYILFTDETGLSHPMAVLIRPELQGLVDAANSALAVVEERLLRRKEVDANAKR